MDKIPLLLMFLGHIAVDASQGILPVVLAKFKEIFQLSYLQVGLMMLLLNFTSSVIQPLFGYISDRFRTGWFVPFGILWTAVAMGFLGWAPNYWTALVLVGMAGIGTAAFHPRAMMAVYHASGLKRGLGAAIFSTGGSLGFALGPVIGSLLVLGLGLHATVGLIPASLLLFVIIVIVASALLYPPLAGLMLMAQGPWIWVLAGASGAALLSSCSVTIVLTQELLPRYLGLASGLILGLGFGTGGLGTAFSGYLADKIGLEQTFWILAIVPLFSAVFAALIKPAPAHKVAPTA